MRILFFESSQIWSYSLPNGFRDAGHQVMISGPLTKENIPVIIKKFQPDLAIVIGWGVENTVPKQEWIKSSVHEAGVPLVYWAVEDPAYVEEWSLPLMKRMQPDFVFTISPEMVDYYNNNGFKAAFMDFGYHQSIHCPTEALQKYQASVAVVANAYPDVLKKYPHHYRGYSLSVLIKPLLEKNIRIDFWGRNWDQMKPFLDVDIPQDWIHGYIPYKEARYIYSSAKIVIGLQNYPFQCTQRTYEILASGGLLLTNDTPGVKRLFQPGRDLLVSASPEETVHLVSSYLEKPDECKSMKDNARLAVSGYSYQERAEYMLATLTREGILRNHIPSARVDGEIYYYENYTDEKYELYIVNPGDSLWGISRKFSVPINQIKELNHLTSDEIYVDQVMKIRESRSYEEDIGAIYQDLNPEKIPGGTLAARWAQPIHLAAKKVQIPSRILYGVMVAESDGNPNLVSKTGGIGLMQLHLETANWLGVNPCDPIESIEGAARYLKLLFEQFNDWKLAVAAYNAGPDMIEKYGGVPPMEEPQIYVQKVFAFCQALD